jgi:hypothetical protein
MGRIHMASLVNAYCEHTYSTIIQKKLEYKQ